MMSGKSGRRLLFLVPTMQVLRTRSVARWLREGGCYYYLVDMEEKTVQPLMNAALYCRQHQHEYHEKRTRALGERFLEYSMTAKTDGTAAIP